MINRADNIVTKRSRSKQLLLMRLQLHCEKGAFPKVQGQTTCGDILKKNLWLTQKSYDVDMLGFVGFLHVFPAVVVAALTLYSYHLLIFLMFGRLCFTSFSHVPRDRLICLHISSSAPFFSSPPQFPV